jgi:hypothetical protein
VKVQWNSIKKCVVDTSVLVGRVKRRTSRPWITPEMISEMDHQKKWKNVNNKGKGNHRRQKNELKKATEKTKKEYHDSVCDKIMEFQRTGLNIF